MIKTYFFIPANKHRFIEKIPEISADNFVLDFEDALNNDFDLAFDNVEKLNNKENFWVRPILFDGDNNLDTKVLKKLVSLGFKNFILPKVETIDEMEIISNFSFSKENKFILLIESAKAYLNIKNLLGTQLNITGISLGSHDFFNDLGMKYSLKNLKRFRENIHLFARAYEIESIDVASMLIEDTREFKEEVLTGFQMGYRSKFILHPKQLEEIEEMIFFDKDEIVFAEKVLSKIPNLTNEIGVLNIEGRILEKPHVKRILEIKKWIEKHESK